MINVVGNAATILKQRNGWSIDQGTVIRFNWGGILDPIAQGTRTDIVVTALRHVEKARKVYPGKMVLPTDLVPFSDDSKHIIKECDWTSSGFRVLYWLYKTNTPDVNLYGFNWYQTGATYSDGWDSTRHNYKEEAKIIAQWVEDLQWKIH